MHSFMKRIIIKTNYNRSTPLGTRCTVQDLAVNLGGGGRTNSDSPLPATSFNYKGMGDALTNLPFNFSNKLSGISNIPTGNAR